MAEADDGKVFKDGLCDRGGTQDSGLNGKGWSYNSSFNPDHYCDRGDGLSWEGENSVCQCPSRTEMHYASCSRSQGLLPVTHR